MSSTPPRSRACCRRPAWHLQRIHARGRGAQRMPAPGPGAEDGQGQMLGAVPGLRAYGHRRFGTQPPCCAKRNPAQERRGPRARCQPQESGAIGKAHRRRRGRKGVPGGGEERFYILTHPKIKPSIQSRMEDVLQDAIPPTRWAGDAYTACGQGADPLRALRPLNHCRQQGFEFRARCRRDNFVVLAKFDGVRIQAAQVVDGPGNAPPSASGLRPKPRDREFVEPTQRDTATAFNAFSTDCCARKPRAATLPGAAAAADRKSRDRAAQAATSAGLLHPAASYTSLPSFFAQ